MPCGIAADRLIAPMTRDKKAVAGELKFILPEKIGRVRMTGITDTEKIVESLGLC
jgi:3-dehydroquinate synthetase